MTETTLRKGHQAQNSHTLGKELWDNRYLYLFVLPGVIWFLLFAYQPMYGIIIAFKEFDIAKGVFASPWVGFKYFADFFHDINFSSIMTNTIGISLLKLLFGFPAPILLALCINEVRNMAFKRVVQTISYLPFFVSWIIVAGIWYELFSVDDGSFVNSLLMNLHIIREPVFWFGDPQFFWGFAVLSDIWKGVGFGTIIYLASIAGINPELYESAVIDGASRLRQIWHITLPSIRPTIIVLLILNSGNLLNAGFEQIFALQNDATAAASEIIDTYVAKEGIFRANYELGTAIGLFKSIVGMIMLFTTNFIVRLCGEEGIL